MAVLLNQSLALAVVLWVIVGAIAVSLLEGAYWADYKLNGLPPVRSPDAEKSSSNSSPDRVTGTTGPAIPYQPLPESRLPLTELVRTDRTPEDLWALFEGLTDLQADELVKVFIGDAMRISGAISSVFSWTGSFFQVSLHPSESHTVYLLFRDQAWLANFKKLKEGDPIVVLGQIERITRLDLQLTNCELEAPVLPSVAQLVVPPQLASLADSARHGDEPRPPTAKEDSGDRVIIDRSAKQLIANFDRATVVQGRDRVMRYLGNWMRVSGPIDTVVPSASHRQVSFANQTLGKDRVYANFFDKKTFAKLDTLSPGDRVSVIGQIRDVDPLCINLDNCELETLDGTKPHG